jgi:integrase
MARVGNGEALDLRQARPLTRRLIAELRCPDGKAQAFLRDSVAAGLKVRVTPAGAKAFVFESKLNGKTLRRTIGDADAWSIDSARAEANRLRVVIDQKADPRELDRLKIEEASRREAESRARAEAAAAVEATQAITLAAVWAKYLDDRRPYWSSRTYADHVAVVAPGGRVRQRLAGVLTKPGPLTGLMGTRLVELDAAAVTAWAAKEAKSRPARVRLALRLLKACLRWAAAEPAFAGLVDASAASARRAREVAGKAKPKDDVLERGQLAAWFKAVRSISNPVTAAYLQTLLLTGGRPGEVLTLRWEDLDPQWMSTTIRDKVEGERQIPLTPYVWALLSALPRRNGWVFSSTRAISLDPKHQRRRDRYHAARGGVAPVGSVATASKSGRLTDPDTAHRRACAAAGLDGLTLHGLRRSFATLTEWLEVPAGVVAQIQGHKPSATAEKHYKRRPLDLLRVHHERIEAWILECAGVDFVASEGAALPPLLKPTVGSGEPLLSSEGAATLARG